jgi:hypothetical protein
MVSGTFPPPRKANKKSIKLPLARLLKISSADLFHSFNCRPAHRAEQKAKSLRSSATSHRAGSLKHHKLCWDSPRVGLDPHSQLVSSGHSLPVREKRGRAAVPCLMIFKQFRAHCCSFCRLLLVTLLDYVISRSFCLWPPRCVPPNPARI